MFSIFRKPEVTSGRKIRVCVEVYNVGKFVGIGRNKRIAKCTAAKLALRRLEAIEERKAKYRASLLSTEDFHQLSNEENEEHAELPQNSNEENQN